MKVEKMAKDIFKKIDIDVRISKIKTYVKDIQYKLPPNESYKLIIRYPLSNPAEFEIKTGKDGLNQLDLIAKIGTCYNKVYKNADKYGIWGHVIEDLVLVGIDINHTKKIITLQVDS